jgi:hypothetical protein
MSNANPAPNNNNNNNNNNNRQPSRKKRRWYYNSPGKDANPPNKKQKHSPTTPHSDNRENERIENEKQVLKMEQQLHEYFHKTNTAYSYIDDNGIYSYTPTPAPTQHPAPAAAPVLVT